MSSANSYVTGSASRGLLEEKKAAFENSGFDLFAVEQNEERFRDYFEGLCEDLLEPFYTNLLVKLRYHRVNELASVLDAIDERRPPLNLVTLVWGSAFTAIKVSVLRLILAGRDGKSVLTFWCQFSRRPRRQCRSSRQTEQFNTRLRPSDATRFPYDTALRAPLYNILDTYADTLLLTILHIQSVRSG